MLSFTNEITCHPFPIIFSCWRLGFSEHHSSMLSTESVSGHLAPFRRCDIQALTPARRILDAENLFDKILAFFIINAYYKKNPLRFDASIRRERTIPSSWRLSVGALYWAGLLYKLVPTLLGRIVNSLLSFSCQVRSLYVTPFSSLQDSYFMRHFRLEPRKDF